MLVWPIDPALGGDSKDAVVRIFNTTLGLTVILLGALASDSALAGRGHSGRSGHSGHFGSHGRIGVIVAAPIFAPFYYPSSGYYTPPLPASPPVYIEQEPAPPSPVQQPYYWYYCADSKTYYPYVKECPGGWQPVVPEALPPS
jgi:hypothetical protein